MTTTKKQKKKRLLRQLRHVGCDGALILVGDNIKEEIIVACEQCHGTWQLNIGWPIKYIPDFYPIKIMTTPELSKCCKAPMKDKHGCDDDLGHGGKPCNCFEWGGVTSWWECYKCGQPTSPEGLCEEEEKDDSTQKFWEDVKSPEMPVDRFNAMMVSEWIDRKIVTKDFKRNRFNGNKDISFHYIELMFELYAKALDLLQEEINSLKQGK